MMTPSGIDRARTVRRLPENKQTDKELLLSATGLPWAPRTAPERSRRRRAPQQVATELPKADAHQQQGAQLAEQSDQLRQAVSQQGAFVDTMRQQT